MDTLKHSYKSNSIEPLKTIIREQKQTVLKENYAYANDTEVTNTATTTYSDPRKALEVAKKWAGNMSQQKIIARTWLEISEGEGRATREFELQWWPDLFKGHTYGKLTFRFLLKK